MSDSLRPHRWQPTRLPHPWDSPGKNTGVGCHFLLQCMKVKSEREVTQSCPTLRSHGPQPTRLLCPWDFPGKSTGVGCHHLLRVAYLLSGKTGIVVFSLSNFLAYTVNTMLSCQIESALNQVLVLSFRSF